MKKRSTKSKVKVGLLVLLFAIPLSSFSQHTISVCNTFDSNLLYLNIDTGGIWEIGKPNKTVFDSSYDGINSIVTSLDSLYPLKDTSVFYATLKHPWGGIPSYLGLFQPFRLDFYHRFMTDSSSSYGTLDLSVNGGITWHNLLTNENNETMWFKGYYNKHIYEGTSDTLYDSLSIFGNSKGWVKSNIAKDINEMVRNDIDPNKLEPDSIIVRFSFISDSTDRDEGWQIDNLCLSIDYAVGIEEMNKKEEYLVYPNPNTGIIHLKGINEEQVLTIINSMGKTVWQGTAGINKTIEVKHLLKGVYFLMVTRDRKKVCLKKMIIE